MKKTARFLWQFSRFWALFLGVLALGYATLPFERLKLFANSLANDGTLELFSATFYADTRLFALGFGGFFLAFFALLSVFRRQSVVWLEAGMDAFRHLPADRRIFWQKTRSYLAQDHDWMILLALMLVGAFFRGQILEKPVYHDEAYTYITFVGGGLGNVISDYHLPNNHILYSIWVFFSTQLFGNAPWTLRLPALIAGLLLIPATYFATRQYFNRVAALLSSAMIALFPMFMIYGTSARGYAQVALLSTLLWLWGILLRKQKNLYLWLLFVITAAAGFYTIPIMIYPYTAMMAWLFLLWLFKKESAVYGHAEFFAYLFISGLMVVALFMLLYTPVFLRSGIGSVINNPTIQQHQESSLRFLRDAVRSRAFNAWVEWHHGLPEWFRLGTLFGVGIALLDRIFGERKPIDYFLASLLTFLGIILLQRSVGWRRVWFFFAPVYVSFAAAGMVYLFRLIFKQKEKLIYLGTGLSCVILVTATLIWWQSPAQEVRELRGEPAALERGILYLEDNLTPNDAILTDADYTPQLHYYAEYHGLPVEQTYPANNQFTSLYVIMFVPDKTVEETLHNGTRDRVDLKAAELIYAKDDLAIYKIPLVVFYEE